MPASQVGPPHQQWVRPASLPWNTEQGQQEGKTAESWGPQRQGGDTCEERKWKGQEEQDNTTVTVGKWTCLSEVLVLSWSQSGPCGRCGSYWHSLTKPHMCFSYFYLIQFKETLINRLLSVENMAISYM